MPSPACSEQPLPDPHHGQHGHGLDAKPDWVPDNAGAEFATKVALGVQPSGDVRHLAAPRRRQLSLDDYFHGVRGGDVGVLARAITLIESNAPAHQELAQALLTRLLPHTGGAMRVGITGIPGAGKSTFIECLGSRLCEAGRKVAVLAVDPSSSVHGGSVLGDKVRMEKLSRHPRAFIRPSPSGGSLGGVARKSREAMLVCEAAGFDTLLIETVGVGQNEVTVRSMVDCFFVVLIAGAGDEMQGIKKGIIELADLVVINKADGDNRTRALAARAEMQRVLHFLHPVTAGWETPALAGSAVTGEGVDEIWAKVEAFFEHCRRGGFLADRRQAQAVEWLHALLAEALKTRFYGAPAVKAELDATELAVAEGRLPAVAAAQQLLARAGFGG
ncbi:MAG TPA: methylmalonyl Co-A mutase-associated GTPase MeaB [Opitutaceae bacterium]|nr:methylmalonyl Co-A mutase-associated GTPase MeaB [Opitutaceae bacterium]